MASVFKRSKAISLPEGAQVTGPDSRGKRWVVLSRNGRSEKLEVVSTKRKGIVVNQAVREFSVYQMSIRDRNGKRITRSSGSTDKKTAETLAAKWERDELLRAKGLIDPVAEKNAESRRTPMAEFVEQYRFSLESKGRNRQHVDQTISMIQRLLDSANIAVYGDLTALKIERVIVALTKHGREVKVSSRTRNAHIVAMKALTNWLRRTDRTLHDPLISLTKANEAVDRRRRRRALLPEEQRRLIQATESGKEVTGMTGIDRAMLYRIALGTGLRASELASLTSGSFDLDPGSPSVILQAAYSKSRKDQTQPIRPELAQMIRAWLRDKAARVRLFPINDRGAEMVSADLAAARVQWLQESEPAQEREEKLQKGFLAAVDPDSQVVDFHSLRHTFITQVVESGASVKVAQELARHSSPTLTIGRYAHVRHGDLRKALPSVDYGQEHSKETGSEAIKNPVGGVSKSVSSEDAKGGYSDASGREEANEQEQTQ